MSVLRLRGGGGSSATAFFLGKEREIKCCCMRLLLIPPVTRWKGWRLSRQVAVSVIRLQGRGGSSATTVSLGKGREIERCRVRPLSLPPPTRGEIERGCQGKLKWPFSVREVEGEVVPLPSSLAREGKWSAAVQRRCCFPQ